MKNKIIIFPTDTLYGIGVKVGDFEGLKKIYEIKNRSLKKQALVLCCNMNQVLKIAKMSFLERLFAQRFWPGGLTLILESSDYYYNLTGLKSVGVRIPENEIAKNILKENAMWVTSLNDSGKDPLNDYNLIVKIYKDKVYKIYKDEKKCENISSTIIDLKDNLKFIRIGKISKEEILNYLNEVRNKE